ncbi:putative transcriptional regulator [Pyrobaculum sp. WP30]|nr:putative transcriptional regulator [Pyrobaculum sp. WP30]
MEVAVGKRIAELREKRGLTLSQLAKLVGMSKSALWAVEQGRVSPTISTLWKIANALGVTFGELVEPSLFVAENGVDVRLIERRNGKEVYIMRLGAGAVRYAEPHENSPLEVVHVIEGAMIVGPLDAPKYIWEGETAKFYGGEPHFYMTVGGGAVAVVSMFYRSQIRSVKRWYLNAMPPAPEGVRDLLEPNVDDEVLAYAISVVNKRQPPERYLDLLLFDVLSAEYNTLAGRPTLPKAVVEARSASPPHVRATSFEQNFDVYEYFIYEPLHPGYAEQAVYVAYELYRRGVAEIVSVACSPAYHEKMLAELLPGMKISCVESSPFFRKLSPFPVLDDVPAGASAVVSFGASHHIDNFLKWMSSRIRAGGLLIVAGEFIADYDSELERRRNVITHHLRYLLDIPLNKFRVELLSAHHAAREGRVRLALDILAKTYHDISKELGGGGDDVEKAFLHFYRLELTSLLLGAAYIEERKTSVEKFVGAASAFGLKLMAQYRVYPTGRESGTYVLVFRKL